MPKQPTNSHWKPGQITLLAAAAGISRSHLYMILDRKRNASKKLAAILASKAELMGVYIDPPDFENSKETTSVYFKQI